VIDAYCAHVYAEAASNVALILSPFCLAKNGSKLTVSFTFYFDLTLPQMTYSKDLKSQFSRCLKSVVFRHDSVKAVLQVADGLPRVWIGLPPVWIPLTSSLLLTSPFLSLVRLKGLVNLRSSRVELLCQCL